MIFQLSLLSWLLHIELWGLLNPEQQDSKGSVILRKWKQYQGKCDDQTHLLSALRNPFNFCCTIMVITDGSEIIFGIK